MRKRKTFVIVRPEWFHFMGSKIEENTIYVSLSNARKWVLYSFENEMCLSSRDRCGMTHCLFPCKNYIYPNMFTMIQRLNVIKAIVFALAFVFGLKPFIYCRIPQNIQAHRHNKITVGLLNAKTREIIVQNGPLKVLHWITCHSRSVVVLICQWPAYLVKAIQAFQIHNSR